MTAPAFNLNGVQATTHMAAPLLVVNGPRAREIGMNGGANAFGSGNRANATIGRAIRLVLLNVGGGWPGDLDKSTLGHPGKYSYAVAENEAESPWAPYHVEKGFAAEDSTVFVIAAEPPHSVTNHVADDPEGILDSICSAMRTIAHNNAVSSGHCAVAIGPEHARTIAAKGWSRHDVKSYLHMNAYNLFRELAFDHRYGRVYNRNLPRWYKREPDVAHPDRAQPRPHPSVRDRRRGRTVFRLHPGLGAYVVAGAARHRGRRCRRRFALRRRHVLFVSWRQANGQRKVRNRLRSARPGRDPADRAGAAGRGAGGAAARASSTTPNGTPIACCAKPRRGWATASALPRSTTYKKESFAKPADPALLAAIAAANDIILTAIGD